MQKQEVVFDIETDGLLDALTKIHVLAWSFDGETVYYTHDYEKMKQFFSLDFILIGHSIVRFDIPAVKKVLGITVTNRLVDTLPLSQQLNFDRKSHGLESYGIDYGVPKPKVTDWNNLTPEDYAHRCKEDVKINYRLWRDLKIKLGRLYK